MSREFLDYVEDILDAMEKAEILLAGVSKDMFQAKMFCCVRTNAGRPLFARHFRVQANS